MSLYERDDKLRFYYCPHCTFFTLSAYAHEYHLIFTHGMGPPPRAWRTAL